VKEQDVKEKGGVIAAEESDAKYVPTLSRLSLTLMYCSLLFLLVSMFYRSFSL